jgi:CheY-like chemotaxis protein
MNYKYISKPIAIIIDDDIESCNLTKRILNTLEIDLISIGPEENIITKMKEIKPNLGFVGSNITTLKLIRQASITIPIFIISADSNLKAVTQALDLGATDYFTKPVQREALQNKLSYYLKDLSPQSNSRPYFSLKSGPYPIQIEFVESLKSIDEFGLCFESPHLIPKGILIKNTGKLIEEISAQEKILTSVISSDFNPATKQYLYYAEFEGISDECLNTIRKWLMSNTKKDSQ